MKVTVNSICVHCDCGVGARKKKKLILFFFFFFFHNFCATLCFPVWMCSRIVLTDTRLLAPLACG